eukprot:COSAG05_NODE_4379_length_1541_cov_4.885366_2_plen_120_part_00
MGKAKDVSVVAHTRAMPKRKGKAKAKPKPKSKPKPKPKPQAQVRQSRRLAGKQPVRGPEPPRKPRRRADSSRAPVKSNFKAERAITGDEDYGAPIYGKGVSILDGALRQFRQAGYHRGL